MPTPSEVGRTCQPTTLYPYSSTATDVWDIVKEADRDPLAEGRIRLLYTRYSIAPGAAGREHRSGWNREHVWPKSLGGVMSTDAPGIGTDAHNLFCADPSVNSTRRNKIFDVGGRRVVDASPAPGYDGATGCRTDEDSWEPPEEAKGVVARAVFYMACAYSDLGLRLVESPRGEFEMGKLSVLLDWNRRFPPDACERRRNAVVASYQGCENPFIRDPALAERVRW